MNLLVQFVLFCTGLIHLLLHLVANKTFTMLREFHDYMADVVVHLHTAISIKVVHEQSGKVEYERERLLGTALKIH